MLGQIAVFVQVLCSVIHVRSTSDRNEVWAPMPSGMQPWIVLTGACTVHDDCVRSPNYPLLYGNSQACSMQAPSAYWSDKMIRVDRFSTEGCCDKLSINGEQFSGVVSPEGVQPIGNISWTSDGDTVRSGWSLCARENVAEGPKPTPKPTGTSGRRVVLIVAVAATALVTIVVCLLAIKCFRTRRAPRLPIVDPPVQAPVPLKPTLVAPPGSADASGEHRSNATTTAPVAPTRGGPIPAVVGAADISIFYARSCTGTWFTDDVEPNLKQDGQDEGVEKENTPMPLESPRRTLATSMFKRLYMEARPVQYQHELFAALKALIDEYAVMVGGSGADAEDLFLALQAQAFNCPEWKRLLGEVETVSIVLWTSALKNGLRVEFCSILNHVIRQDFGDALCHAVVLCRAMASLVVSRRVDTTSFWPEDFRSHRGVSMPRDAVAFFVEGLLYRVPMFLSTSVTPSVAYKFMQQTPEGRVSVHFIFHVDPIKRCDHVLYLEPFTLVSGERELLYVPYSAFKVLKVTHPEGDITWDNPIIIELMVQPNNKTVSEDVPLAEWH